MPIPYKVKVAIASSLIVLTGACFGTVNRPLPASTKPAPKFSEYVHVKLRSGDTLTLHNAALRNDSIVGVRVSFRTTIDSSYAAPVASVQSYSARKVHKGRTILLVSVVFFTVMALVGAAAATGAALGSDGGY